MTFTFQSGFSEYRLHRYAPLSDLATLKSTSSSGSNYSSKSTTQSSIENNGSDPNPSTTIKTFISCEDDFDTDNDDDQDVKVSENKDPSHEDIDSKDLADNFLKPEVKVVRGKGPRALRRRPGINDF